jgi:hypothetical protein
MVRPVDRHIEGVKRAMGRFLAQTAIAVARGNESGSPEAAYSALGTLVQAIDRLTRAVEKEDRETRVETFLLLQVLGPPAKETLIMAMGASRDGTLRDLCVKGLVAIANASHAGAIAAIVEAAAEPVAGQRRPLPRAIRKQGERRIALLEEILAELPPGRRAGPAGSSSARGS